MEVLEKICSLIFYETLIETITTKNPQNTEANFKYGIC